MTGDDFIQLAAKLAATYSDAASCRTAINRAYYGAFHLVKSLLDEIGVQPPKNANTHGFVRQRMSNSGFKPAETISSILFDLYTDRIVADYDLTQARVDNPACARACVERASRIQTHWLSATQAKPRTLSGQASPNMKRRSRGNANVHRVSGSLATKMGASSRKTLVNSYQAKYGGAPACGSRPIVEQSEAAFLKCGDLREGFARVRCPDCKHEMFVAFSCKLALHVSFRPPEADVADRAARCRSSLCSGRPPAMSKRRRSFRVHLSNRRRS